MKENIENDSKTNLFSINSIQKRKRKSVQLTLNHLEELIDTYSSKNKKKNYKLKKVPKDKRLSTASLLVFNKEKEREFSNKDKNNYLILNNTNLNDSKPYPIPIRSSNRSKGRTIKEKSTRLNLINKDSQRSKTKKGSQINNNRYTKINKYSEKNSKKKKKFESSSEITKAKRIKNIRRTLELGKKNKKLILKNEEENDEKNEEDNKDKKIIKLNLKENIKNKNDYENKDEEKKEETNKKKEITNINNNININYIETKNNYEVKPNEDDQSKNKKKIKRKILCFCCLTKEENSSDFD